MIARAALGGERDDACVPGSRAASAAEMEERVSAISERVAARARDWMDSTRLVAALRVKARGGRDAAASASRGERDDACVQAKWRERRSSPPRSADGFYATCGSATRVIKSARQRPRRLNA